MMALKVQSWCNTLKAAMNPQKAKVMATKLFLRLADHNGSLTPEENMTWLLSVSEPLMNYLKNFSEEIEIETKDFVGRINQHGNAVLANIHYNLGGGAGVPLLYAVVRTAKPRFVVETGVAAGFSSATILEAMSKNGSGHLYSSDFPYFRIANPEQYVGVVVEQHLKTRWSLYLKGDTINLSKIMQEIPDSSLDLFHYDSDKSYKGRDFAMRLLVGKLSENGIIIMDDIQDNSYFYDFVKKNPAYAWKAFSYENKFIGMLSKAIDWQ